MRIRSVVRAMAVVLAVGCGGDDAAAPDSGVDSGGGADAGPPDGALAGACYADLVDLDDPDVGQRMGNQIIYMGTVRAGAGTLDPQPGCVTGGTTNEKAHKLTPAARSRLRATTF